MKTRQAEAPSLVPRFHEWPLVVFTTLAIIGAGLLTAPLVSVLAGVSSAPASAALPGGTALLAAGLLVSLAHLGQPRRSPLALARAGRSRLSNEVILVSLTVAAGAFVSVFPSLSPAARLLPSVAAIAFLVSLGLVYALPGQLAWRGVAVASPLMLGLAFGMVALAVASSWNPAPAGLPRGTLVGIGPIAALVVAADAGLFMVRKAGALRHTAGALRHTPRSFQYTAAATRLLLVDVLPVALLLRGLPRGAAGVLGLGILVDRLTFYLLAHQHTTEREIARVEEIIAGNADFHLRDEAPAAEKQ